MGESPVELMKCWNHQTHLWLKHYVMTRLISKGQRPGAKETIITFLVSAMWHGFYPFYYFMFFFCGCFIELIKDLFKAKNLFKGLLPHAVMDLLQRALIMIYMNYMGISFSMLTFERGNNFGKGTYYFVYASILFFLILSR
jgi:lysophospholipid acyltransferase